MMTGVRVFIAGLLWGIVLTLLATVFIAKAWGAEPYVGADGTYHYHDSKWPGIWIAESHPSCCGKSDCEVANKSDALLVKRLEDGSGYIVQYKGQVAEFVPFDSNRIKPSQDGEYWVCHMIIGGEGKKSVRCLFTPPLGF